jgi:hypothetical protein
MGYGIFFLFYNFVRMLAIISKKTKEKNSENKKINGEIKSI